MDVQVFADMFVQMQEKRHEADYDPKQAFYKSAVQADIDAARVAIKNFQSVDKRHRRAFSAYVLLKERK